jgi:hypothetical protein
MTALAVTDPAVGEKLAVILRDRAPEIFCFASSNYHGTRIRTATGDLLHRITGIPLAILLHDHPLHFLELQNPALDDTITLVPGEDLADFVTKYYPTKTRAIAWPAGPPNNPPRKPDFEQFLARENAILCPMNLHVSRSTVDSLWFQIKQLPAPRRDFSIAHVEASLTDCTTPLHVVAERLPDNLLGSETRGEALSDLLLVMNFVKLWRRNAMVRALIDLPIHISTEYIPADLEARYPKKFRLISRAQTLPLYSRFRFTLNANPTMDVLHDRVLEAVASGSVCISDPVPIFASLFRDRVEAIWFDYLQRGMVDVVAAYMDDPEAAFRLTEAAHDALLANGDALIGGYRALVETVSAYWREREPVAAD